MSHVPEASPVTVEVVCWEAVQQDCLAVRRRVFVAEQGVPEGVEVDGRDPACVHVLARDAAGRAVGTGRLQSDGRLGRLAVLPEWRGAGVGTRLLVALEEEARRRSVPRLVIHAQMAAQEFYARHGYRAQGAVFTEAGIGHRRMVKALPG